MMMSMVTWGQYSFFALTPEQQHLAIQYRAESIYHNRMSKERWGDWAQAIAQVATRDNPYPKDELLQPVAQKIYEARATKSTDETRRQKTEGDWLEAEKELLEGNRGAWLPVDKAPQLTPSFELIRIG
jgi:hypothetical protein